jgi:hypothetical protein
MFIRFGLCTLCIALIFTANPVSAQVAGSVTGSIFDQARGVIPSATVNLMMPGGAAPLMTTVTTSKGLFTLTGVPPGYYDLIVHAPGFGRQEIPGIKVDPAQVTTIPAIALYIGTAAFRIEVVESIRNIQTTSSEVASTITNEQVRKLPSILRNPLTVIDTQAGVNPGAYVSNDFFAPTVINGQRASSTNVTLDGITITDNYIRNDFLFTPNSIVLDQVAEFTLISSNPDSTIGGGSSHIVFVTPSGTNRFRGSGYYFNSHSALAANDWFNNRDGIERPSFNRNQIGGALGGPIKRDKLYFYANYEAFRYPLEIAANRTILTADARNGIFTYENPSGTVQKVNILEAAGVSPDPAMKQLLNKVPGPEAINNYRLGDSRESLLRNTAGYSFLIKGHNNRDNITAKLDYKLSPANVFAATFLWNRRDNTQSDLSNDYSTIPKVSNRDHTRLFSLAWRWNVNKNLTNELRGGFNLAPVTWSTSEAFGDRIITNMIYSNPVNTYRAEGRNTDTYHLMDNADSTRGKHALKFGFQMQQTRVEKFNDAGFSGSITPTYSLGIGLGNPSLSLTNLPGSSSSDLATANALLATLAGYVTGYSQVFNITSRESGFVPGAPLLRHYALNNYAFYVQDTWKFVPRLTLNLGLRYELPSVVDERDSLALLPVVQNNNPIGTLLSNSQLDFAGSSAGRPWYSRDRNNFAPNIGFAWDATGDGKTALRGGYSISFINDETIAAISNNVEYNEGLMAVASGTNLSGRVSENLPPIPTPKYKVPRTFADNFQNNAYTAFGLPDPNLRTPYVQQWSFGIQRTVGNMVVEVRYVGNHSTKLFRGYDVNSEVIRENGFLDDFNRALQNGRLARQATGAFIPDYNPAIAGSKLLTVFPQLYGGGWLWHPVIRNLIESKQAGELAFQYHAGGFSSPSFFYRNPSSLASMVMTNASNTCYNALQIDVRRWISTGFQFQANYAYGKVLSDANGILWYRWEMFRDPGNGTIDRARPRFDITHAIKGNLVYDITPWNSQRFGSGPAKWLFAGWSVSGKMAWHSGYPFSILSGRGTLLRDYRSNENTADSPLSKDQLDGLLQFRMTDAGPYIVAASAIGSDGRAVASDDQPAFKGQAFYHPDPGEIGGLQQRWFSGPWIFGLDFALLKNIRIHEEQSLEFRVESLNVLNHPTWFVSDQNIDSYSFGKITNTSSTPRRLQFSLHYQF